MKFERGKQPKCDSCSHSKSFHGGDRESACKAMGCSCPAWVTSAEDEAAAAASAAEVPEGAA